MQQPHQRRPHPRKLRRLPRLLIDRLVRRLNRRIQPRLDARRSRTVRLYRGKVGKKRLRRKMARNLSSCGPAHSITNHKGPEGGRCGTGVFITAADASTVREHCVSKFVRCQSRSEKIARRKQYTLERRTQRLR